MSTTDIDPDKLTAADIARLLPPSWSFTFQSIEQALDYYHPNRRKARP